ncbi:MAG: hypothetical protein ACODAJ_06560 [Planctomycetota bacterium]
MNSEQEWGRFGWHGIAFEMPQDWCPGRLDGDFRNGYVRIEDETEVRAELRWETGRRRRASASQFVDNYIKQVRRKTRRKDPDPTIERDRYVKALGDLDHEVFTWRGVYNAHSLMAVCPTTRRVVHLRVFFEEGQEQKALTRRMFASLEPEPREGLAEWSAFGFRFLVGEQWQMESSGLRTGCLQFLFADGDDELEVARFSLARMVLRDKGLEPWLRSTMRKTLRKFRLETEETEYEGWPAVRCEGALRLVARPLGLFRRRRRVRVLAWHREDVDKIVVVRLVTTTADDPQLEAIAESISLT